MGGLLATCNPASTSEQTRSSLIEEHANLVSYLAERMAVLLPAHLDLQDLIQDGILGLLEAIDRYDPSRGVKFRSFAAARIRGSMLDGLRSQDWMSKGGRKRVRDLKRAEEELSQKLHRPPTEAEIGEHTNLPPEEVRRRKAESTGGLLVSLDQLARLSSTSEETLAGTLPDAACNIEATVCSQELYEHLKLALSTLDEREQLVLQLYYNEDLGMKEIAALLGVSKPRVSQLHSRAVERLRGYLKRAGYPGPPV